MLSRAQITRTNAGSARLRVVAMAQPRRVMSAQVVHLVQQARREAARQGCMFVGLPHLVVGLLATPCRATATLNRWLNAEAARAELDKGVVLPVGSGLGLRDVDMSPVAREMLAFGMECAREQGSDVLGSGHLAVVLIQEERSPLRSLLHARQAPSMRSIEDEILADAEQHPESADAGLVSPEEQVAQLRRLAAVNAGNKGAWQPGPLQDEYE